MEEAQEKTSGAEKPDWARLAGHALDLWQAHLSSLASDAKAKEDMARLIAPMSQAFADWTVMLQQGMETFTTCAAASQPKAQTQTENPTSPPENSFDDGASFAPVHAESVGPDGRAESFGGSHGSEQPVSAAVQPEPISEPSVQPVIHAESSSQPQSAPEGGRPASPDGPRDLAQLAGRLAELERELDALRARSRKRAEADGLASDGEPGRVAGASSGATSS